MDGKILPEQNKVVRHSGMVRLIHWLVAGSTCVLIFSGLGELPLYQRYMVDQLPGLSWASDYGVVLVLHYAAAMVLVLAALLHVTYHGLRREFGLLPRRGDLRESWIVIKAMFGFGQEPPADKFLAEQRVAYAYIAANLALIIITGFIKMAKNLPGITVGDDFLFGVTAVHNLCSVLLILGVIAHLVAFIFKANRPLFLSMFTGKVDLDYVRERHPYWYARLANRPSAPAAPEQGRPPETHILNS